MTGRGNEAPILQGLPPECEPDPFRVRARPSRKRVRQVTDRQTGRPRVVEEKLPDPVPAAVNTALVHRLHGAPPERAVQDAGLDAEQESRFWSMLRERLAQ